MTDTLKRSVRSSIAWTKYFNRRDYAAAFQNYCAQFSAAYAEALQTTDAASLAEALLTCMEEQRQKLLPWRRKAAAVDDKMLLLTFISPMLLASEHGSALAEALRTAWGRRSGEAPYELADYETIAAGFCNSVMGFRLFGEER